MKAGGKRQRAEGFIQYLNLAVREVGKAKNELFMSAVNEVEEMLKIMVLTLNGV